MSKRNRLDGLPYNLVQSYFATDKYHSWGYMSDWLFNAGKEYNIDEIIIDIINKTHIPSDFNFSPFTYELFFLNLMLKENLSKNGFDQDFIVEAKIKIILVKASRGLICSPWLVDLNGHKYNIEPLTVHSYNEFNPININKMIKAGATVRQKE